LNNLINLNNELDNLIIYRNLLEDPIILSFREYISTNSIKAKNDFCYQLITYGESKGLCGNLWQSHIITILINDENPFSLLAEKDDSQITFEKSSLAKLLKNELSIIKSIYNLDFSFLAMSQEDQFQIIQNYIPSSSISNNSKDNTLSEIFKEMPIENLINALYRYYNTNGCGIFSRYNAFKYDNKKGLIGIDSKDTVRFSDLVGYKIQQKTLIDNTEAFIKGHPANNVLLFGDKGTGKSSCIKALLNEYSSTKLRIIEISKEQLKDFSNIVSKIMKRAYKFIIFMDDLSFEEFEVEYKYMKSILEGSIEVKPSNVLVYATSNRRHLIRETWKEREESISVSEAMEEKLSLVDRFGITITFSAPDKQEYLDIIFNLAEKHNIQLSKEDLTREALRWEMKYNGRSGRTATQFINHLLGR